MASSNVEEEVPTMDTNTDEISPVEWLAGLEATNARQAADEYRKLGILFLVSHLPVLVSLSTYPTDVRTAFSVLQLTS